MNELLDSLEYFEKELPLIKLHTRNRNARTTLAEKISALITAMEDIMDVYVILKNKERKYTTSLADFQLCHDNVEQAAEELKQDGISTISAEASLEKSMVIWQKPSAWFLP